MTRAIIIDDEEHCINRLSSLLQENCIDRIHLMDSFRSVEDGLSAIKKLQPDLVFLDVQINDKTGFDLLSKVHDIRFEIIFTTAFEKYAVQAFRFSALDYLLKPINADDLKMAVSKINDKRARTGASEKLKVLLDNLQGRPKRIGVPVLNGIVFLQVSDIIRCESDVNYTTFFMSGGEKLMVAKTLKEFEELLEDYNFFRVHNSHLINLDYVKNYVKGKGGYVVMDDKTEIEVSTRRKDAFLKKLAH